MSVFFILSLLFCFFLLLMVAFLVLFERNILGLSQMRKSPNITSFLSMIQTISDGIKLLLKSYVVNPTMRIFFFVISPLLGLFLSIFNWSFLSISFTCFFVESSVIATLFISSIMVYSVVLASWGSNNIYSTMSSLRAVAQMISYEVVMGFFVMMLILSFSSFSWGVFHFMNLGLCLNYYFFFFFFFWVVVILAELNRTPFDLVESESELVSSFNVEYSSSSFTLLFLSEYMNIWFMSSLSVLIFLHSFFFFFFSFFFVNLFVCCFMFLRALLPRFKFVDLINLMWLILLPMVTCFFFFFLF